LVIGVVGVWHHAGRRFVVLEIQQIEFSHHLFINALHHRQHVSHEYYHQHSVELGIDA